MSVTGAKGSLAEAAELIDDFEPGHASSWYPIYEGQVGCFAGLATNLQDLDPCRRNSSPQVVFVDAQKVIHTDLQDADRRNGYGSKKGAPRIEDQEFPWSLRRSGDGAAVLIQGLKRA